MTERNPPSWLQGGSHPAEHDRLLLEDIAPKEGCVRREALEVTERAAGTNMSVDVAAGSAFVAGDESASQGVYHVHNDAVVNLAVAASDATNPRKDIVVARVRDAFYSGSTDAWALEVITGTPASTPSEPAIPDNALRLATIDVAAGATAITNADITDRRAFSAFAGEFVQRVVYTSSGSFVADDYPWMRKLFVRVQAGGGGGGGCPSSTSGAVTTGGPGGGGGYAERWLSPDDLDADGVHAVTVGSGGSGGAAGSNGGNTGGTSSFQGIPSASGGNGGGSFGATSADRITGGVDGGQGTNGNINARGGGAGPTFRLGGTTAGNGPGGSAVLGGGAGAVGSDGTAAAGKQGGRYGGGGTGAASSGNSAGAAGGDGGAGIVVVDVYA